MFVSRRRMVTKLLGRGFDFAVFGDDVLVVVDAVEANSLTLVFPSHIEVSQLS